MSSDEKLDKISHLEESVNFETDVVVFDVGLSDEKIKENLDILLETDPSLENYKDSLYVGAILANDNDQVTEEHRYLYSDETIQKLELEEKHPITSQPPYLFLLALSAAFAAVNFGHDESAVGGAQLQYTEEFNITNSNIQGLVNASPYLTAGLVGSPLAIYLDKYLGRRVIIFLSCLFGIAGSLWQAFSHSMGSLLAARLFLGIGMGLNSAIVPMLIAESSPHKIRGVFLVLWQTFIAFGVMLGSIFNRAFVNIPGYTSWRLMIGASFVAPVFVAVLMAFIPESPRYLISVGKYESSLKSLIKLRSHEVIAARDFYKLYQSLKKQNEITKLPIIDQIKSFFVKKNLRFAFLVSSFNMFMQQYCGVNVLVGYTTTILVHANIDSTTAIAGSIGIGGGCFLATFFSSQCIDRFGRRPMLLATFPFLAICLFWLGGSLYLEDSIKRLGSGLTAMYLFVIVFGFGIGPISWTYNAEVYPLNVRTLGVATGLTINWVLDFVLSMTWPKMAKSMGTSGGLFFYGAWNIYAIFFTFFFIPETKGLTLEEIETVFAQGSLLFAKSNLRKLWKR